MNARTKLRTHPKLRVVRHREPDPEMVDLLGEVYQVVQTGDVVGLAIVTVLRDGDAKSGWIGNSLIMLGAAEVFTDRLKAEASPTH